MYMYTCDILRVKNRERKGVCSKHSQKGLTLVGGMWKFLLMASYSNKMFTVLILTDSASYDILRNIFSKMFDLRLNKLGQIHLSQGIFGSP